MVRGDRSGSLSREAANPYSRAVMDIQDLKARFDADGYVGGIRIVDETEAADHRRQLEWAEAQIGPLHYQDKVHTILTSPLALATHPVLLDAVEALIGPDILLYNAMYIVKEPRTPAHIDWHQDLTYWGLDDAATDGVVSAWLALSPATAESGCMLMVPGSHTTGPMPHKTTEDITNLLHHGQSMGNVDPSSAKLCPLAPGETSLHHGWTVHSSQPNRSDDRRIGVNIQYMRPEVRQTLHDRDTAMLVRGEDRYGHFATDVGATSDLDPDALAHQELLRKTMKDTYDAAL